MGSPAHAGIDRMGAQGAGDEAGFPRTRGDRPDAKAADNRVTEVPPHTRG